jgi:HSP20 family protein
MPRAATHALTPYEQQQQQNPLWDMQRRMNADFNRLLSPFGALATTWGDETPFFGNIAQQMNALVPAMDVRDTGNAIAVSCELPGLRKEDVNIELHSNRLTISGQRSEQSKSEGENWISQERRFGNFSRTISLPEGVRPEDIHADFANGMLELTVQKPQPTDPVHRIQF